MFGVTVFTWGTDRVTHKYLTPIKRQLEGGKVGHTAVSLVIPDTPENQARVEKANKNGELSVTHSQILVRTDKGDDKTPPKTEKRGAIEIYLSFWPNRELEPKSGLIHALGIGNMVL